MTRVVIILSSDNIMTIVDHERFSDDGMAEAEPVIQLAFRACLGH